MVKTQVAETLEEIEQMERQRLQAIEPSEISGNSRDDLAAKSRTC